jgi:enamine deaminase RidA (YjgF/YER057c/UK114 family)
MLIEKRLAELGLELPAPPTPAAAYVPTVLAGDLLFTAGQVSVWNGEVKYKGKLGTDFAVKEGYEAAKICALNCLSVIKARIGDLDKVEQVVKMTVFVNSAPDFIEQPLVANGASELLADVFGDAGKHARAAVGTVSLPRGVAVEVEMVVRVRL